LLWEGLRIYSRAQYEALGPENRFILTDKVRDTLHPDLPDSYLGHSIVLIQTSKKVEVEVEGSNFLAVDDDVPDFTVISMREAERRYPTDVTECRLTGSTLIAKLYQDDQDDLMAAAGKKKRGGLFRRSAKTADKPKKAEKTPKADKKAGAAPADKPAKKAEAPKPAPAKKSKEEPPAPVKKAQPPEQEPVKKKKAVTDDGTIRPLWKRKK